MLVKSWRTDYCEDRNALGVLYNEPWEEQNRFEKRYTESNAFLEKFSEGYLGLLCFNSLKALRQYDW